MTECINILEHNLQIIAASTLKARLVGLLKSLSCPLFLPHCKAIHTFGMREPLHLLWLGAEGQIVRKDIEVKPGRIRICLKAKSVVEFLSAQDSAQAMDRYKIGDSVNLHPHDQLVEMD